MRSAVILILLLAGVAQANACSCAPMTRAETFARADLVISGTVTAFEPSQGARRATIRVARVRKGPSLSEVQIHTPAFGPACGVSFRVGQQVTVAATRRDGRYFTSSCLQLGLGR